MSIPAVRRDDDLTATFKRALMILLEDKSAAKQGHYWEGPSARKIFMPTIVALFDRYLIKIVVESRHRKRQTAMLTDIGRYAALQIQREFAMPEEGEPRHLIISESSARFIAEIVT